MSHWHLKIHWILGPEKLGSRTVQMVQPKMIPKGSFELARFIHHFNWLKQMQQSPMKQSHGPIPGQCPERALLLGTELCRSGAGGAAPVLWAALTLAILEHDGRLKGVATAADVWLEIHGEFNPQLRSLGKELVEVDMAQISDSEVIITHNRLYTHCFTPGLMIV